MQQIADIFTEAQESNSISTKIIYSLLDIFEDDKNTFFQGIEQCYLKIMKHLLQAPRHQQLKFEKLAEKLFQTAYEQYNVNQEDDNNKMVEEDGNNNKKKKQKKKTKKSDKVSREDLFSLFQYFIEFYSEGIESHLIQIKVFCARILFFLLKTLTSDELAEILDEEVAKTLIVNVIGLLKDKRPMVKKLGIKLSSYIQYLGMRDELQHEIDVLKYEMLRIMCNDDNDDVRDDAVTNLDLNEGTFAHLVKRVRDKSLTVRQKVFRKLIQEQVMIVSLPFLADIYKLIYDGLGARDMSVKEICVRFLSLNYKMFEDEEKKYEQDMEVEKPQDDEEDEQDILNGKFSIRKPAPTKQQGYKEARVALVNFLETFELQKTLYYPHLYKVMEEMIKEMVKNNVFESELFSEYFRELLQQKLVVKDNSPLDVKGCELFFLRVFCDMLQDPEEKKEIHVDIQTTIEDCFPSGLNFCKVIEHYAQKQQLFELYQSLLLGEMLINTDETGRDMLLKTLEKICVNIDFFKTDLPDEEVYNDVMRQYSYEDFVKQQFSIPYYEPQIIMNINDLYPIIIRVFRKLIPDNDDMARKILSLISEVKDPLDKTEEELGLEIEHAEMEERIQKLLEEVQDYDEQIKKIKGKKANQQQLYQLEQKKMDTQEHAERLQEEAAKTEEKIQNIKTKTLVISQALFMNCRIGMNEPLLNNLLKNFIVPHLEDGGTVIKAHACKAIALFVMTDRKICEGYTQIYIDMLKIYEDSENFEEIEPWHIISLKAITDFLMMYNFSNSDTVDVTEIANILLRIAFKAELMLKTLAVEGLCKLLLSDKLQEPTQFLSCLILLWFDPQVQIKGGFKIVQILSAFFKKYVNIDFKNIQRFEQSTEIILLLLVSLKEGMIFNQDFISIEKEDLEIISRFLHITIENINYQNQKVAYDKAGLLVGPCERLFFFICKKAKTGSPIFQTLYQKFVLQYDFLNHSGQKQLTIVSKFFDPAFESLESNNKDIQKFKTILENSIKKYKENEQEEDLPDNEVEDEVDKINEELANTAKDAAQLIRNLTDFELIVSDKNTKINITSEDADQVLQEYVPGTGKPLKKQNKKRKQKIQDDELDVEDNVGHLDEQDKKQQSEDEEEIDSKAQKGRKRGTRAAATKKDKKKPAKQNKKKRKPIDSDDEVENEDDLEDKLQEESSEKQQEESESQQQQESEQQEESESQQQQEEESEQQQEDDDEEQDEESEQKEEEKTQRTTRRQRNQAQYSPKAAPKQAKKTAPKRKQSPAKKEVKKPAAAAKKGKQTKKQTKKGGKKKKEEEMEVSEEEKEEEDDESEQQEESEQQNDDEEEENNEESEQQQQDDDEEEEEENNDEDEEEEEEEEEEKQKPRRSGRNQKKPAPKKKAPPKKKQQPAKRTGGRRKQQKEEVEVEEENEEEEEEEEEENNNEESNDEEQENEDDDEEEEKTTKKVGTRGGAKKKNVRNKRKVKRR